MDEEILRDNIENAVCSSGVGYATYFKWHTRYEDNIGKFVSLCHGRDTIRICENGAILGVTVSSAGFVGNHCETVDDNYGLVVTSGVVHVKCESDVEVGDHVSSNQYGRAQKTTSACGYKVMSIAWIDDVKHAIISLGIQADVVDSLGCNVVQITRDLKSVQENLNSAINLANEAYKKATTSAATSEDAAARIEESTQKVVDAVDTVTNIQEVVAGAQLQAAQAKAIAESAAVSATSLKEEALQAAEDTKNDIEKIKQDFAPIAEWTGENGSGASYFVDHVDGLTGSIETVQNNVENAESAVLQTAKDLRFFVTSTSMYVVGVKSPSNGMTLEQAKETIEVGMVYVPIEKNEWDYGGEYPRTFETGYSCTWDGTKWVDSDYKNVKLSYTYAPGVKENEYWYVMGDDSVEHDGAIYEPYTLYLWKYGAWMPIATVGGSVNYKISSQIRQDANSIRAEVAGVSGSVASLTGRIGDTEANVQSLALWSKGGVEDGEQYNLATIKQTAEDAGASVALVVQEKDGDKVINSASIITAVNNDKSGITIKADHIQLDGIVSFVNEKVDGVKENAVYDTKIEYALSSSATQFSAVEGADGEWSTTAPPWRIDAYMWQKITITKGDATTAETCTCIQGAKGSDGTGVYIKGTAYVKDVTINDDIIGKEYELYSDSSCTTKIEICEDGDSYLVSGYLFVYCGSDVKFTCAGIIQGPPGDTGAGVSVVINYYMASSRSSGVSAGADGWITDDDGNVLEKWVTDIEDNSYARVSEGKPYLWNYEVTKYTRDKGDDVTTPTIIGNYSKDGRGIVSVEEFYRISDSTSCNTPDAEDLQDITYTPGSSLDKWYKNSPPTDNIKKYLWNCEKITYTDDTFDILTPALIGTHGEKGRGTSGIVNYYYATETDNEELPDIGSANWKTNVSELTNAFGKQYKYLWNYEVVSYDDTTSDDPTDPTIIGVYSKDGKGIQDIIEYYLLTETSDAPDTLPTATDAKGWTKDDGNTTLPQTTSSKPYLWNCEIIDYTDGADSISGPICIGTYGNSIKSTTEYYAATSTNQAPGRYSSGNTINTDIWKTSLAGTGQSETKPYVWNFERTQYTIDNAKDTEVTLLTSTPRAIKRITEYYCIIDDDSTPNSPYFVDTNTNHNAAPIIPEGWFTTKPQVSQGDSLWNCEVVEYAAVDENGNNLYEIVSPARIGYAGTDGTGVAIKGTAYIKDVVVGDNIIGYEYELYSNSECTTKITSCNDGDSYLVSGYLFVYCGSDIKFTCVGQIQGPAGVTPKVDIDSDGYWVINGITSPVKAVGLDAPKVQSVKKQYYLSSSKDELCDGEWSDDPADFDKSSYMWVRDVYTMSDGSTIFGKETLDNTFTTISSWCKDNNTTLIDGASIATGTIHTEQLNAKAITSTNYYKRGTDGKPTTEKSGEGMQLNLSDGTWDSANFKIDDEGKIDAQGGKMAGWDISSDEISKGGLHICSGDRPYRSLINSDSKSNLKIYSGEYSAIDKYTFVTSLSFSPGQYTCTKYPLGDNADKLMITDAKYSPNSSYSDPNDPTSPLVLQGVNWRLENSQKITINANLQVDSKYRGFAIMTLPQTSVLNQNIISVDMSSASTGVSFSYVYLGSGRLKIYATSTTSGSFLCIVKCTYMYTEYPNVSVTFTDDSITADLIPEFPDQSYNLLIDYVVAQKKIPFAILEDGSLYARNAEIHGNMHATGGSFTGIINATGGSFTGEANITSGQIGNLHVLDNETFIVNSLGEPSTILRDDYLKSTNIATACIYGLNSSNPLLKIVDGTNVSDEVVVENANVTSTSQDNVTITINLDKTLTVDKEIYVDVFYSSMYGITQDTHKLTIQKGSNFGSISVPRIKTYGVQHYGYIRHEVYPMSFKQPSGSSNILSCLAHVLPSSNKYYDLGLSTLMWRNIYSQTCAASSSDRNQKNTIEPLTDAHTQIFDALQPVSYKFNENTSDRTHIGLIAQDVKSAVEQAGMTTKDFAGYCEWTDDDGNVECGLRYGEFIALCIDQIQKLKRRVEELEKK